MICQGNNHKTPLRHSSLCAALLLLPRSCRGTWVLQRVQQGCTQPPSHGPGHIQPSNPKQTLPERRPFLSKGESSQSPAEEDMGTTELPTSRCTVASQQSSGETRLLDTSKSQDTRNSERTPPQNTFQMSPDKFHVYPNSICPASGWPGASTGCRSAATAALSNKIVI